ncbi:MAG: alkaline phosphatase family protein [Elusimicrobiota bacterium]
MGFRLAALALFFAASAPAEPAELKDPPCSALLIGWDGVSRDRIKEALAQGALPNLKRLAAGGALVAIDIHRRTETVPGWTQILTGYEPERTGAYTNSDFVQIPKGYTIFERLKDRYKERISVGSISFMRAEDMPADEVAARGDEILRFQSKGLLRNASPAMDFVVHEGLNDRVGAAALKTLESVDGRSFFYFFLFKEPDVAAHDHKDGSSEQRKAIAAADAWLGRIMDRLKEKGLDRRTFLYVTADHGFDVGTDHHSDAPYVFLATNDATISRRGDRVDIGPTILERFGIDTRKIDPPLDGHALNKDHTPANW